MKLPVSWCLSLVLGVSMVAGCDKPSESDCKQAITNIRTLMGTSKMSVESATDAAWIRSCRGAAKKASVKCAMEARSLDQLKTCGLLKGKQLEEIEAIEQELKAMQTPPPPPVDAAVPVDAAAPLRLVRRGRLIVLPVTPVER